MTKTLFERLGSREGIAIIVNDALENHMNNPNINARFLPYKNRPEYLAVVKQHTIDFFIMGSGGPSAYKGRDMTTTHTGMNINPGEYMYVIDDIFDALDKNGIDEDSKKDVLAILWSLKGMILSK